MAHTVLYPVKNFFHPIGNTPTVVLTDTLSPEERADLLLLGCGDPGNIIFTIYNQANDTERPLNSNLTVASWNTTPLTLDGGDYGNSDDAPTSFNIIDASNITDQIGLLNVLIAIVPLLSPAPSATLFTEALQYVREDAAKRLTAQLCANVSTMGLLLDLIPINCLSNSNTHSNNEEAMATKFQMRFRQYHEIGLKFMWSRTNLKVTTDPQGSRITTLTARANITDVPTRSVLSSGTGVSCHQVSPCVMEVRIGQARRSLIYPLPVIGSRSKLKVAKKSFYVEVVVPIAEPPQLDGFSLNRFPISLTDKVGAPWNPHHLQLDCLPVLSISNKPRIGWTRPHIAFSITDRERALRERDIRTDTLTNVKTTVGAILLGATGIQQHKSQIFGLKVRGNFDTVIFVPTLRFDLASHTLVADAYVLPLNPDQLRKVKKMLAAIAGEMLYMELHLRRRGRNLCGKGKDISAAFTKEKEWASAAPFVTRVAIGPLFGVPCVEGGADTTTQRLDEESEKRRDRCVHCGGPGKPKLLVCGGCKNINYCSAGCQKEDWKKHKPTCKK